MTTGPPIRMEVLNELQHHSWNKEIPSSIALARRPSQLLVQAMAFSSSCIRHSKLWKGKSNSWQKISFSNTFTYLSRRSPRALDWSIASGSLTSIGSKTFLYDRLKNGIVHPKNRIESMPAVWRGFDCNFLFPVSIFVWFVLFVNTHFGMCVKTVWMEVKIKKLNGTKIVYGLKKIKKHLKNVFIVLSHRKSFW